MAHNITLNHKQLFKDRQEISSLLGGDVQKGIAPSSKANIILLFRNENEIYTDYFYPKDTYDNFMYTGIGREGHQDSLKNNMYNRNLKILSHRRDDVSLLVFDKLNSKYCFIGEYQLTETHQNIQPDKNHKLRRVFVFHLKLVSTKVEIAYL